MDQKHLDRAKRAFLRLVGMETSTGKSCGHRLEGTRKPGILKMGDFLSPKRDTNMSGTLECWPKNFQSPKPSVVLHPYQHEADSLQLLKACTCRAYRPGKTRFKKEFWAQRPSATGQTWPLNSGGDVFWVIMVVVGKHLNHFCLWFIDCLVVEIQPLSC